MHKKENLHRAADDNVNDTIINLFRAAQHISDNFIKSSEVATKRTILKSIFRTLQLKDTTLCYDLNFPFNILYKNTENNKWRMGRDSNPRWSCPHNGFQDRRNRPLCHPSETVFFAGLSNRRFCSLTAPGGAAHHSFALDCADACLADSYARPSQSTALPPIRNFFFHRSFKPTVSCTSNAHYSTLFFAECNRKNCGTGNKHYS